MIPLMSRSARPAVQMVATALVAVASAQLMAAASARAAVDPCKDVPEGALCNDQSPCTTGDACRLGRCVGTVAPDGTACTDGNLCTASDLCAGGACVGVVVPDGTACDDENACTTGEICGAGRCEPRGVLSCNDFNPCTADLCVAPQGCLFSPLVPCPVAVDAAPAGDAGDAADAETDGGSRSDGASDASPGDLEGSGDGGPGDDPPDGTFDDAGVAVDYQIEGGACVCSLSGRGEGPGAFVWSVVAALTWALRTRRRARRRDGKLVIR
jgi:hypothetical protein